MYALMLSDGTVSFRHRGTMDPVLPDENTNEVQSLPQSGFAFPTIDPCMCIQPSDFQLIEVLHVYKIIGLHATLSPGGCVVATLQSDGDVKLENAQYMNGDIAEISEDECMFR
jgi:hypothetical protein